MAIEWDPKLSVGVSTIDLQHQELFRRVNALLDAMQRGAGKEVVAGTVTFLKQYVVEHFAAEQALMVTHHYPGYAAHERQHEEFVAQFLELAAEADKGISSPLILKLNQFLCGWLRQHIGNTDKALGRFLLQVRSVAAA
jgi:hemerythrin